MIKKIYEKTRFLLPDSLKGKITYLLYKFGIKPILQKETSPLKKGIIVFSADFEMAWAFRYSKNQRQNAVKLGLQERDNIPKFIELFEEYNIPITWATVGHLFMEKCKRTGNKAHANIKRPHYFENRNWIFQDGDWYDDDPCSDFNTDPAWYAPDLIDNILKSKIEHEIGCHTFSHIDFSDKNCSTQLADSELKKCIQLANQRSLNLTSMVFPGGTFGNFKTLKKYGFKTYRQPMNYDLGVPKYDKNGLLAIPSTLGLDKNNFGWPAYTYLEVVKKFIKKTSDSKMICHFWFHPSMNKWYLKEVFPLILDEVNKEREKGLIEIKTMSQVTDIIQNHE